MAPLKSQSQFIPNVCQFYISRWCSFSFPPSKCCSPTEDKNTQSFILPWVHWVSLYYIQLRNGICSSKFPSEKQTAGCDVLYYITVPTDQKQFLSHQAIFSSIAILSLLHFTKITVIKLIVLGHLSGHNFRCVLLANINIFLHNTAPHLLKYI